MRIPALRERSDDIPLLVGHFLERYARQFGRPIEGVTGPAMQLLQRYAWPGNVRELRNVLERMVILGPNPRIAPEDLPAEIRFGVGVGASSPATSSAPTPGCPFELPEQGVDLEAVERGLLAQALARTSGNQSAAARLLGITRYALRYRMEKFGVGL
jgi:DNA-binding NtrC family response regulator